jgi:Ca2+-binding EF-hand superfamily protein
MDIFEKPFLEFLSYYAMCEERLIPYKMSSKQLENAFKNLDKSRKGYLDVADLYAIDPEMTEQ